MFAKWIFTAAAILNAGQNDLPPLVPATKPVTDITARTEVYETAIRPPCASANECPGITFVVRQRQVICTAPGVWTVTLRLGLLAQEPLGGKVWIESLTAGGESLLAAFNAAPGAPAFVAGSMQVQSLYFETCYRVRVDTNRPAEVIAEPGVSFVTVGR